MPPKTITTPAEERATDIIALCHVIMSCDEFKADNNKLAPILNIAQAKNVPRKINSIVNPFGFEFKSGKMILKDESDGSSIPSTPKGKTAADGNGGLKTPVSLLKKKATPKKNGATAPKKGGATTPKTRASKKRKLAATSDEDDPTVSDENVKPVVKDEDDDGEDSIVVKGEDDDEMDGGLDDIKKEDEAADED